MKAVLHCLIIIGAILLVGCKAKKAATPTKTAQSNLIKPGDIIVINTTSRSLLLLDSDGVYKTVLYDLENAAETIYGIGFKRDTKEIMITINGAPRVGAISVVDGSYRNLIADANLTGTLKGVTQLADGDIVVIESTVVSFERFSSTGVRRTAVGGVTWPNTLSATAAPEQIHGAANGDIIVCGSTNVNRFTNLAVRVGAAVVSGIAGTVPAMGCIELESGLIAAVFSGTTDTIRTFSASMLQVTAQTVYSDLNYLSTPRWLTQTLNGNILSVDSALNQIVEVTTAGVFVRTLGGGLLGTPNAVFSVPNY